MRTSFRNDLDLVLEIVQGDSRGREICRLDLALGIVQLVLEAVQEGSTGREICR